MSSPGHPTLQDLASALPLIRSAPRDGGVIDLVVRRPAVGEREVLDEGRLDLVEGLVGDTWRVRRSSRTPDGSAHPDMQLTVMASRVIAAVARSRDRWPLAGDQLYVDMDLSEESLPAGARLALGGAVIEVTAQPHTGCKKFVERFGLDAMTFVSSPEGRALRLRGLNARVVHPGVIRAGDVIRRAGAGP